MARRPGDLEEERRSYSAVFLFAVGLLLAGAVWSVWDDNITRRPWKKYQARFFGLEADQVREAIEAEEQRLAADPTYQEVAAKIRDAETRLTAPETVARLRELEGTQERAGVTVMEYDLALRIVKSKIEEGWYEYEHAVLTGLPTEGPKHHLEALEEERRDTDRKLKEAEARQQQIANEIAEIRGDLAALQKQQQQLEAERDRLAQRLEGLLIPVGPLQLPKIPKIEQIVLNEFDRGNFNTPLNRVDRCPSCHIGLEKAGFEEQPNPLKSHPHRELLGQHPLERFGCTPCHQGQGAAINSPEQAHGEVKFWEHPLLRGDTVDVGCIRCHADTRHLPPAKSITRGQILFEELGCHGCHLTEGYETLTKVGPSLRRLAAKTDPSWLVRWVKAPQAFRPRTRMPNFEFTDDQAIAVAAYLLDSSRAESDEWLAGHHPPPGVDPSDAALVARGRELVDSIGCRGCHGIGADESPALLGENKDVAPNLAAIAEKTNPRWLYHWIKNPSGYSHMARMPSLRLTDDEARAIASFLATLGRPERDEQLVARLDDADTIAAGKSLVRKYGCFGCHEVTGMENESRIGVELSTFASKPLEELFFGNHTDIPFTWDDWTYHKLKSPRTYATERIEQVMPNFQLSDADIRALRIFLKSRIDEDVPSAYLANTERSARIMRGRRLVARYNCVGCHVIEGDGGAIRARYEEQPTLAPPILTGQGAKVQPDWFFGFLKEPIPLRPWLKVRMPTFPLSDEDATALVEYFMAVDEVETPYFHVVAAQIPPEHVEAGRTLVSDDYFACFSCHQQGDRKPEGPEEGWAPDLSLARERLNPDWIIRWIRNPQAVQPGTKMPSFYPGGPDDVFEGDEERQIRALRDYIMLLGSPAQLASVAGTHNGAGEPENAPVAEDEQAEEE